MLSLYNNSIISPSNYQEIPKSYSFLSDYCSFSLTISSPLKNPLSSSSNFPFPSRTSRCTSINCIGNETMSTSSAYSVLGVSPNCSFTDLKAAFRAKVKQFHPDLRRDGEDSDIMIRRVIQAYEILSNCSKSEIIESECLDPFDKPECEALDLFVNEVLCAGKGCPYSCVTRAPYAFKFGSSTGTACASSQGHGEDYQAQLAVGQCPRNCIHYVTPSQRIILEELFNGILNMPFDCSAEAELLYSLIVKAKFENNRYQKPKRKPNASTQHVDCFLESGRVKVVHETFLDQCTQQPSSINLGRNLLRLDRYHQNCWPFYQQISTSKDDE